MPERPAQLGDDEEKTASTDVRRPVREVIAASVGRTLDTEARRNEVRVARLRVAAYGLIVVLDLALWLRALRPASNLLWSAGWVATSVVILFVLRRAHRRWLRFVIPVVDALLIYGLLWQRIVLAGHYPGSDSVVALSCALLATTGAMRFDRKAALWTSVLATVLLLFLIGARTPLPALLYSGGAIYALGLLTMWLTDLVRRSMDGARGEALLARFLPKSVVEQAFRDPLGLVAEPRVVEATVMVTDLRGFTALAETLPPAEVLERLNQLQGALADAVQRHGGTVDKFMGDGMLAVFGAPEPLPDHAQRALDCAQSLRRALARLNLGLQKQLRLGVGIHSGPVVAGCLGAGNRLEFTVIGDTVNTASRLESLTKELDVDVLVSDATASMVHGVPLEDLGEVAVRGRQAKLRVHTLGSETRAAVAMSGR